jgi:hypothetical protein
MQKSELKTPILKNSLNQGDLNIIMLNVPLKKNIKICIVLYTFVHLKSSKHYSTETNSDSKFFIKKYTNSPILSTFVNQNYPKLNAHNYLRLLLQMAYAEKHRKQTLSTHKNPYFLPKNETIFKKSQLKQA